MASWFFPNGVNGRNFLWILSHESRVFLPIGWLRLARFFFRWVIWLLIFMKFGLILKFYDWAWDIKHDLIVLYQNFRLFPFFFHLMIVIINKVLSVVFFRSFRMWMLAWCFLFLRKVGIAWILSTRISL